MPHFSRSHKISGLQPCKINNLKIKNRVKKGDVLLKLEAMKMEYSLIAPRDGIIKEIFCKNGEQVTENSKLLNLEKIK